MINLISSKSNSGNNCVKNIRLFANDLSLQNSKKCPKDGVIKKVRYLCKYLTH